MQRVPTRLALVALLFGSYLGCSSSTPPTPQAAESTTPGPHEQSRPGQTRIVATPSDWLKPVGQPGNSPTGTKPAQPAQRTTVSTPNTTPTKTPSGTAAQTAGDSQLEGECHCVKATMGGQDEPALKHAQLVFKGNNLTMTPLGNHGSQVATIAATPKNDPKTIDLNFMDNGRILILQGLYRIEGNTLEINCGNPGQVRPKDFTSQDTVLLCERGPAPDEPASNSASRPVTPNQILNDLANIGLAMHNHHDIWRKLPAAEGGKKPNKGLSWRVALLPFLEEPQLYDEFHHDEPWDSPHNKALIAKMPEIFGPNDGTGKTRIVTFRHESSMFPGEQQTSFGQITDGTSQTLMVVQAAPESAVIWTKPDDLPFDPADPKAGLDGGNGSFWAVFADGHRQQISLSIEDDLLRALVSCKGGDVITPEQLEAASATANESPKKPMEEPAANSTSGIRLRKKIVVSEVQPSEISSVSSSPVGADAIAGMVGAPMEIMNTANGAHKSIELPVANVSSARKVVVEFSPEPTTLAIGINDELQFLSLQTGQWKKVSANLNPSHLPITRLDWIGPDRLLIGYADNKLGQYVLIDVATEKVLVTQTAGHINTISSAVSHDGKLLVLGVKNALVLYDLATYKQIGEPITLGTDPDENLGGIAFSPDDQYLAASQYWSVYQFKRNGNEFTQLYRVGLDGGADTLCYTSDGTKIFASGWSLDLLDAKDGKVLLHIKEGHGRARIAFDGKSFLTKDRADLLVWEIEYPLDVPRTQKTPPVSAEAQPEENTAAPTLGFKLRRKIANGEIANPDTPISEFDTSPVNPEVAVGATRSPLRVWNTRSGDLVAEHKLPVADVNEVGRVTPAYSPDGEKIAVGIDSELYLLSVKTGEWKKISPQAGVDEHWIGSLYWIGGDRLLIGYGNYKTGSLYLLIDVESVDILLNHPAGEVLSLPAAHSHDLKTLALGINTTVVLYDLTTYKPLGEPLKVGTGERRILGAIAFSPDDKLLAVEHNESLTLWKQSNKGFEKVSDINLGGPVSYALYSPDATKLLLSGWMQEIVDAKNGKSLSGIEGFGGDAALEFGGKGLVTFNMTASPSELIVWDFGWGESAAATEPKVPAASPTKSATTTTNEFRTWTSADGKFTIEAKLRSVINKVAQLEKADGTVSKVPVDKLSEEDQAFIADQSKK